MRTLIVILLDESASMFSKRYDVIAGFNEFIASQKQIKADEANVIFIKFNTLVGVVLRDEPIGNVPPLVFNPAGNTALYDAIWEGVQVAEEIEAKFDRVICVIMTDGEDNSSRKITGVGIGDLIKKKEGQGKWTFLYIGENPDRWAKFTMNANNVASFNHQAQRQNFQQAHFGIQNIRNQPCSQMPSGAFSNFFAPN